MAIRGIHNFYGPLLSQIWDCNILRGDQKDYRTGQPRPNGSPIASYKYLRGILWVASKASRTMITSLLRHFCFPNGAMCSIPFLVLNCALYGRKDRLICSRKRLRVQAISSHFVSSLSTLDSDISDRMNAIRNLASKTCLFIGGHHNIRSVDLLF